MGPDPLLQVRELLDSADRQVVIGIRHEPTVEAQRLLASLGAGWRVDAGAPRCVLRCGRKECKVSDQATAASRARTMGQFVVPGPVVEESPRTGSGLTFFTYDERCDGCPWPQVCGDDRTCWRLEREEQAKRRRHAAEARRQTDALAAMDAGEPQPLDETGLAEDAAEDGDPPAGDGGGSVPAALVGASAGSEVGKASSTNPYGLAKIGRGYAWTPEAALAAIRAFHAEHGHPPTRSDDKRLPAGVLPSGQTCVRLFGSWAEAIETAGFERPTKGTHYKRAARAASAVPVADLQAEARPAAARAPRSAPAATRGWIKVAGTGLAYRTPEDAYVAAIEIEADGERVAAEARRAEQHGKSEQALEASIALAQKIRVAARAAEERAGTAVVSGEEVVADPGVTGSAAVGLAGEDVERLEPPASPRALSVPETTVDEAPPEPAREAEVTAVAPAASVSPTGFLTPRIRTALAELLLAIAIELDPDVAE